MTKRITFMRSGETPLKIGDVISITRRKQRKPLRGKVVEFTNTTVTLEYDSNA